MDIWNLTPEDLQRLPTAQLQEQVNGLTAEQRSRLTPAQMAAVMGALDPRLSPTDDERQRREAAWTLADSKAWRGIAASCIESAVWSYEQSELELEEALAFIARVAIGCLPQDRVQLLGLTAVLAFRVPVRHTRKPGERKPLYPTCVRNGAADLIITLKESHPQERVTPGVASKDAYDPSSPVIKTALETLAVMRWFGEAPVPNPATIDEWVRVRRREQLPPGTRLPAGRPPSKR